MGYKTRIYYRKKGKIKIMARNKYEYMLLTLIRLLYIYANFLRVRGFWKSDVGETAFTG